MGKAAARGVGVRVSENEERERRQLYDEGLNDRQIGEALNLPRVAIKSWRRLRKLPGQKRSERGLIKLTSFDGRIFGGLSLLEKIADPRFSSWLEEMGATVW